jgi:hypothetical protein
MIIRTTAALLLAAGLATTAVADTGDAMTGGMKLTATLSGANEVPPADPDGTGMFSARLNPGKAEICYQLAAAMIDTATAAHIHRGAAGANGPVVVTLAAPADGSSDGCVALTRALATELRSNPEGFYINVHNPVYPGGAVRGQLVK